MYSYDSNTAFFEGNQFVTYDMNQREIVIACKFRMDVLRNTGTEIGKNLLTEILSGRSPFVLANTLLIFSLGQFQLEFHSSPHDIQERLFYLYK